MMSGMYSAVHENMTTTTRRRGHDPEREIVASGWRAFDATVRTESSWTVSALQQVAARRPRSGRQPGVHRVFDGGGSARPKDEAAQGNRWTNGERGGARARGRLARARSAIVNGVARGGSSPGVLPARRRS